MNNLLQRRADKAVQLNYKLQSVKDKYSISSGENKLLAVSIAKNIIKKDDDLSQKIEAKSKKNDIIEQYKLGKISYDDVEDYIEQLDTTYSTITNTTINILTGITAMTAGIAVTASKAKNKGPWIMAASIAAGALAKVGYSLLERSRNNIKGDEINGKQIAKDAFCGALNGAFSGVSAGIGNQITSSYIFRKIGFEATKQAVLATATKQHEKNKYEKSTAY